MTQLADSDAEFAAMQTLYKALEPLNDDARKRVVDYILARFGITSPKITKRNPNDQIAEEQIELEEERAAAPKFTSFAELHAAAQPGTNAHKALVAGYWLQVGNNAESFDGFSVNKELKHVGEGLSNVTNAIDTLRNQKPALALQLRKS